MIVINIAVPYSFLDKQYPVQYLW